MQMDSGGGFVLRQPTRSGGGGKSQLIAVLGHGPCGEEFLSKHRWVMGFSPKKGEYDSGLVVFDFRDWILSESGVDVATGEEAMSDAWTLRRSEWIKTYLVVIIFLRLLSS